MLCSIASCGTSHCAAAILTVLLWRMFAGVADSPSNSAGTTGIRHRPYGRQADGTNTVLACGLSSSLLPAVHSSQPQAMHLQVSWAALLLPGSACRTPWHWPVQSGTRPAPDASGEAASPLPSGSPPPAPCMHMMTVRMCMSIGSMSNVRVYDPYSASHDNSCHVSCR